MLFFCAVANENQQRDKRKNNLDECFLRAKCSVKGVGKKKWDRDDTRG